MNKFLEGLQQNLKFKISPHLINICYLKEIKIFINF